MCDYHLKNNCFHPEKVSKGLVAKPCVVHDCEHCTNKNWQKEQINANFSYYQSIIDLIGMPFQATTHGEEVETIQEKNNLNKTKTSMFLFKNPLQTLFK